MSLNVGSWDRVLRVVVGLVLIALAATGTVGLWGWIGVVPVATGLFGFCPAYSLLGIKTCPMKKN
ncbi:YgaP family membrane protein [Simplicispira suum]|jgi:hypothetical protein|uniref:DUF2892 domain-containing protein n=1 Tax=Simplicispira suum TaxID=2109915 RepID=A0A2S0N3J1_9BURK|nr:DUF2892 domain-containing protein [Simplicispira suum]AVO42700.1 DUF2892 domain-containing protein [Simplicispira suum]MBK7719223.1 DUF2892 domain-containing protein [Simplicispira sp.]MBW7832984.1 DUF2892 domain-containing protein [Simplicispira suum]